MLCIGHVVVIWSDYWNTVAWTEWQYQKVACGWHQRSCPSKQSNKMKETNQTKSYCITELCWRISDFSSSKSQLTKHSRGSCRAEFKMFYMLSLEVHILRRQHCILFLVHLVFHFCSFPINVSIHPLTGKAAVESLCRVLLNAVPARCAAYLPGLHGKIYRLPILGFLLWFTWEPGNSQGTQLHSLSSCLVLQSSYNSTLQFLWANGISRKASVALKFFTTVIG